jgi:GntR family transcriptional regulator, trigonelline degradation regulator
MRVEKVAAPLRQQVLDSLRSAIVGGGYRSGGRLIERELCERIGVSRTLIREALRQLEAEGLVTVIPNKGPVVATITPERAADIYQVRAVLEAFASRLFAENAGAAQKQALAARYVELVEAHARGDVPAVLAHKTEFYQLLMAGCGNEVLYGLLRQLMAQITLLRATTLSQKSRLGEMVAELGAMVEAIRSGDGPAAWQASIAHVDKAAHVASRVLGGTRPRPARRLAG